MLPSERYAIILEEVSRQPAVSIRSLTDRLGVSRETVRKDIEYLAQENKLSQVRGGATQIRTMEPPMAARSQTNREGKAKIARHVADQIPDGATLIIDNGSTTLAVANVLAQSRSDLVIYTNDLKIAGILGPVARELTVLGGRLDPSENATMGLEAIENLSRYRAEFALIGAGGLSARSLFTDFSREAADLRNQMLLQAENPLVLVDRSKLGVVGQVVMRAFPQSTKIILDAAPPRDISDALGRARASFEIAK